MKSKFKKRHSKTQAFKSYRFTGHSNKPDFTFPEGKQEILKTYQNVKDFVKNKIVINYFGYPTFKVTYNGFTYIANSGVAITELIMKIEGIKGFRE